MSQKIVYSDEEDIKPKKQRKPLSDEQKNALRERLAKAREAKKIKNEQLKAPPSSPEPVKEEEDVDKEGVVKQPLTKPAKRTYKKKDVKIELEPIKILEPVVTEEKPKRRYVRKPKITIPNPF